MRALIVLFVLTGAGLAMAEEIDCDFRSRSYDRWLFRTDINGTAGRWDGRDAGLRATFPKGDKHRSPIKLFGRFRVEGDFEVFAQYRLKQFPRPQAQRRGSPDPTERNNLEILVAGHDGYASVFRAHWADGDGHGYHVHTAEKGTSESRTLRAGFDAARIGLRRTGSTLHVLQGPPEGELQEIAAVAFCPGPIDEISLQVMPMNTTDSLDVRFDRLAIQADRIIRPVEPGSGLGWMASYWWMMLLIPAIAALVAWRRSSREAFIGTYPRRLRPGSR